LLNKQQNWWAGKFGIDWARTRNSFSGAYSAWERDSQSRLKYVLTMALKEVPRDTSILELGCNDGWVLKTLDNIGFNNLSGLDINQDACKNAIDNLPNSIIYHQPLEHPYVSRDMIITSAVLIHIHPDNLENVMKTMYMQAKKYIFGRELSTEKPMQPEGISSSWHDYYFTRRFKDKFLEMFPQLKVKYYDLIQMQSKKHVQTEVYLLEKPTADY